MKKPFFIFLIPFLCNAVTVDIYQSCNFSGDAGDSLDSLIMGATSWGHIDGEDEPVWTFPFSGTYWYDVRICDSSGIIQFPDNIIVNGTNYNTTVSKSLSFLNKNDSTGVQILYGAYPRYKWQEGWDPNYSPYHDRQLMACYYTPNDTAMWGQSNTFDIVIMGVRNSYAVLQLIGEHTIGAVNGLYIRSHGSTLVDEQWVQTIADSCISVSAYKTYWVNLYHDGPAESTYVAVFDPENSYAQVGPISATLSRPWVENYGAQSRIMFGRVDAHGDIAEDTSYGIFSHIMIQYTNPTFPLLPDLTGNSHIHYVSDTGTGTWEESKDINTPCSLSLAMDSIGPLDTVYIRGGYYDNDVAGEFTINPSTSGTADSGILIENYQNEEAIIAHGDYTGISLSGVSYITVRGLTFHKIKYFLYILGGHHNWIDSCVFDTSLYISMNTYKGSYIADSSTYNRVSNCEFYRYGGLLGASHASDMIVIGDWGNEESTLDSTRNNCIEHCIFAYGGHSNMTVSAHHNVIRYCEFHNEAWDSSDGDRSCMSYGKNCYRNLYYGNVFHHAIAGLSIRSEKNIIRKNKFYNHGQGGIVFATDAEYFTPADSNYVYQNTFVNNGDSGGTAHLKFAIIFSGDFEVLSASYNRIQSNMFYLNNQGKGGDTGSIGFSYGWISPENIRGNWNNSTDPVLVYTGDGEDLTPTGAQPNFTLQSTSTAIDSSPYLTDITSASGGGTSFTVTDAGYFCDGFGWGGDTIQIEGYYGKLIVTSVDYATNTITVNRRTRWTVGDSVSLAWSGLKPDYGAIENEYKVENSFFRVLDSSYNDSCVIVQINAWKSIVYIDTGNGSTWAVIDSAEGTAGTIDTLFGRPLTNVRIYGRSTL